jgi:hypothetical protein
VTVAAVIERIAGPDRPIEVRAHDESSTGARGAHDV